MGGKKEDRDKNQKGFIFQIIAGIFNALHLELFSPVGRINILSEFMLLVIIVVYLFQSTTTSVARIIASIWNTDLTSQTDDNIVTLLIIFFASFILCLGFIFIADQERKHFEKAQDEVKEELSN